MPRITRPEPFSENTVAFRGDGVSGTVTAGQTVDFDIVIPSPGRRLNGGIMCAGGAAHGDYFICQVVDVDNVLGAGAGFIVDTWIDKYYVAPDTLMNLETPQAGFIPQGLYLRIKYTSTGGTDVNLIVNYRLYEDLVT